ncbi:helix-turn-helix transcriptional regulator [Aquipseudomonas ullengensis]|uniref:Response regulator transcription factor n=1 Tax=Aquipseudomonas ullengensis TaxID=2759166 RepID=A0A7W4LM70_9GAMM|nr:response regulator transcription factor [Pseudomonas ullengensis]MBB2495715.1 response regulator transcription factor [Pseudomonas ullengensis]
MDRELTQLSASSTPTCLGLLSGNELLGQLLHHYIDHDLSLQLRASADISQISADVSLWLLDVQSFSGEDLDAVFAQLYSRVPTALVNSSQTQAEELVETYPWINGVFYSSCPRDQFLLGVNVLLKGGDWLPRGLMERLLRQLRRLRQPACPHARLTQREREILELVRKGLPNAEIAAHLCLSPHTIKSHIHNLLRKIGAANRAEAVFLMQASSQP